MVMRSIVALHSLIFCFRFRDGFSLVVIGIREVRCRHSLIKERVCNLRYTVIKEAWDNFTVTSPIYVFRGLLIIGGIDVTAKLFQSSFYGGVTLVGLTIDGATQRLPLLMISTLSFLISFLVILSCF